MSHFAVLVVTNSRPDDAALAAVLQPFHEFECTGIDDQYVQDIDRTEECLKGWEENKEAYPSFQDFLEDYQGVNLTGIGEQPDLKGQHKYGYALVDHTSRIVKVIDRTNPNKEWDWWVVGGRWSDMILTKNGERVDCANKGNIAFNDIREIRCREALEEYEKIMAMLADAGQKNDWHSWKHVREVMFPGDIDAARSFYNGQPQIAALSSDRFSDKDKYLQSREEYVLNAAKNSFSTFAVLKDGKWSEKGDMGWWGCVHDEKEPNAWHQEFQGILDSIRDDQWLTIVDCHI